MVMAKSDDTEHDHEFVGIPADKLSICAMCHMDHWRDVPPSHVVTTVGIHGHPVQVMLTMTKDRIDSGEAFTMHETQEVLGMAQRMLTAIAPHGFTIMVNMIPTEVVEVAHMVMMARLLSEAADTN